VRADIRGERLCTPRGCSDGPTAAYFYTHGSYLSIVYFIVVTLIGTYIIMTLFIVILLERFAGQVRVPAALCCHRPPKRYVGAIVCVY